jgi:ubiquinone/menaquinone biosynthesis C-methylase UbiE
MPETITVPLQLQSAYDEQYTEALSGWRELGARYKARNIRAVCRGYRFARLLECGAGEGSILQQLDAAGFGEELHAVEIAPSGLRAIGRRSLPRLAGALRFNGYNLPYRDKSFDLAILSHVLEHVEHPRLLLRELRRVSRYLVIEVPLDYSPQVDRAVGYYLGYGHLNIFTPALLRFLLRSEGFEPLRDRYDPGHGELQKFQLYRMQGAPRTALRELRRRAVAGLVALRRGLTPPASRREFRYQAYCVLCEARGEGPGIFNAS